MQAGAQSVHDASVRPWPAAPFDVSRSTSGARKMLPALWPATWTSTPCARAIRAMWRAAMRAPPRARVVAPVEHEVLGRVQDANPPDDITNRQRIAQVYFKGVEIDRAALAGRLKRPASP